MRKFGRLYTASLLACGLFSGCSRHDEPPQTPAFRGATPTNRSTVYSWERNKEPYFTQPGVNGGAPAILPPVTPQHNFEPNDPLAQTVYLALIADGHIPTKYLAPRAKDGMVILEGTVDDAQQRARAEEIARGVPGVKKLVSKLKVIPQIQP